MFLPAVEVDAKCVMNGKDGESSPAPSEIYTASKVVKQNTKDKKHQIVTSSRTVIDDILLWLNALSMALLMFECVCKVFVKYRISFKIKKCNLFNDRFEYVGCDILTAGSTTARSK